MAGQAVMTKDDFRAWMGVMGFKTQGQAAEALGVSVETVGNFLAGQRRDGKPALIDLRTALACAALAQGIGPWTASM